MALRLRSTTREASLPLAARFRRDVGESAAAWIFRRQCVGVLAFVAIDDVVFRQPVEEHRARRAIGDVSAVIMNATGRQSSS